MALRLKTGDDAKRDGKAEVAEAPSMLHARFGSMEAKSEATLRPAISVVSKLTEIKLRTKVFRFDPYTMTDVVG